MVEQQELKTYNLLSSYSVMGFHANDPGLEQMWYIVSALIQYLTVSYFLTYCTEFLDQAILSLVT